MKKKLLHSSKNFEKLESKLQQITVRSANIDDIDSIISLQNKTFPDDELAFNHDSLRKKINDKSHYVLVAEYRNRFAGYASLTDRCFRPWTGGDFLAVEQDFFGRGIGAKIMMTAFQRAKRPLMRVFVARSNMRARKLYKKLGFRSNGVRKAHYPNGEDALVLIAFTGFG
ncbi:MAG: GNAT family N-acetyltransferase [Lentilitoribacter sp.]